MAKWFYCPKCNLWHYMEVMTVNRCPKCFGELKGVVTGMAKYDPDEFFNRKKPGLVEPKYISPIQITLGQIQYKFDDDVYRAVLDVGIKVDKAELIKALNYDRAQYAQGYADGLMERPFAKDTNVLSNADRIRQKHIERIWNMSDGELAEFLNRVETDGRCGNLRGKHGWLDWLQQEVDNGNDMDSRRI